MGLIIKEFSKKLYSYTTIQLSWFLQCPVPLFQQGTRVAVPGEQTLLLHMFLSKPLSDIVEWVSSRMCQKQKAPANVCNLSLCYPEQCLTISCDRTSLPHASHRACLFLSSFQSRIAPMKGGLQLLRPRLTPGRTQLRKVLSNTDRDEVVLFVSDANIHRRLLQRQAQLSAQGVSGDSGVTGTTEWWFW